MSALSISDLPETVMEGPEEVVEAGTMTFRNIARRAEDARMEFAMRPIARRRVE